MTLLIQNLDYTVSFLCLLFALHMARVKTDNLMPARLFAGCFFILAVQAMLLYLISVIGRPSIPATLLPAMPLLLGPMIFFIFKSAATPDFRFKAIHGFYLLPAILAVTMMATHLFLMGVDYLVLLSQLGYAMALAMIARKGSVYFFLAGSYAGTIYRWLLIAAGYLFAMFVADLMIYLEIEAGGSAETSVSLLITLIFKLAVVGFMLLMALQNSSYFEWIYTVSAPNKNRSGAMIDEQEKAAYEAIIKVFENEISKPGFYEGTASGLKDMAHRLEVPIRQLSRAVNYTFGESYSRHMNRRRVLCAKEYIKEHPKAAMIDVMFEAGFRTKSSFNKEFKAIEGMSPSEFRDSAIRR